jgi:hypothetical protein
MLLLNNDTEIFSIDSLQTMAMQVLADEKCGIVGMRLVHPDDGSVQHGGVKICNKRLGICGAHVFDHSREPDEYVNDERISFGVTFAVAMVRPATFERLGMLEEIVYPNAFGDVAMCARAIEAGLKNYYFGTLVGLHYERKTRGLGHEDAEYVAVGERYSRVFSHWMLRNLSYVESTGLSQTSANPATSTNPFRYKVADRINDTLKAVLGPAHPVVRSSIHHSWRLLRGIRSRMILGRPTNDSGWMNRLRRVDPSTRSPRRNHDAVTTNERA